MHLGHGTEAAQQYPECRKTVEEMLDSGTHRISPHSHAYRNCHVVLSLNIANTQISCTFQRGAKAKLFLKGITMLQAKGHACPTRQCRFIEYEDLPLYSEIPLDPPTCIFFL